MPRAKKQPSGNWKVQVFSHTDENGKKHKVSFTAPTKAEAERMAAAFSATKKMERACDLSFGDAMDDYIAKRSSVLSPNTLKEYRNTRAHHVPSLMAMKLSKITSTDIQRAINLESASCSPKTVRNINGLISAVLGVYRPDFVPHVDLPKKKRPEITVPDSEQVKIILDDVKGTEMELLILLAALGPMRRGEVCALRWGNIQGNTVHVCENMTIDGNGGWTIRTPKTYAGDRYIEYPDFVADLFRADADPDERITSLTPAAVTRRFQRITKRLGVNCRFHDLRHYGASILHTIMPDQYIMQRGGWSSDATLKAVYRHSLDDQARKYTDSVNSFFSAQFGEQK